MPALEVVLIELRQFPDTTELALEASGRPLRVLLGEIARSERLSGKRSRFVCDREAKDARDLPADLFEFWPGEESLVRRPRVQGEEASSGLKGGPAGGTARGAGAFKPMMRLVTLLTVEAAGCDGSGAGGGWVISSAEARFAVSVDALALPKLSFHREGFFVGTGTGADDGAGVVVEVDWETVRELSNGVGIAYIETGSKDCCLREDVVDFVAAEWTEGALDCLLSSRARDWEATARVTNVSS